MKPSSKTAIDAILRNGPAQPLAERGYRKQGRSFFARDGDLYRVIHASGRWWNGPNRAELNINLSIVLPFHHEMFIGQPLPRTLGNAGFLLDEPLQSVIPAEGAKFERRFDPAADLAPLTASLTSALLAYALPWLEANGSMDGLAKRVDSGWPDVETSINAAITRMILLSYFGRHTDARAALEQAQKRWDSRNFRDVAARLKIAG